MAAATAVFYCYTSHGVIISCFTTPPAGKHPIGNTNVRISNIEQLQVAGDHTSLYRPTHCCRDGTERKITYADFSARCAKPRWPCDRILLIRRTFFRNVIRNVPQNVLRNSPIGVLRTFCKNSPRPTCAPFGTAGT